MKKVIIVGAGILGSSVAYHLSKHDVEVTLIDREEAGQATGVAAGIICPWLSQRRNKAWYTLAKNGARYYSHLIAELAEAGECDTGYEKVGAICLHEHLDKLLAMKERAEKRREEAPEIGELTLLSEAEALQKFPLLSRGYYALHVEGAARVDGKRLTAAMRKIAIKQGVTYLTGSAELVYQDKQAIAVKMGDRLLNADEVIVCAGAWSNELLFPLGIKVDVSYQKAQIVHVQATEHNDTCKWPVIIPPNDQYMLAFDKQKVVIGATHENDVVNYNIKPTVAGIHDILHKGVTIAEGLQACEFTEVKVGFRPFTANYLPIFGRYELLTNLWIANGLGSSGLTAGPYVGLQLANLVLGRQIELNEDDYRLQLAYKKD